MIKLIGVVIILVGLVLKLDTLGVVLVEGLSTGLESGLGIGEILSIIGGSFYFYTIYVNFLINIISGKCRQVLYGTNGKKVSYLRLTPGTFFGEMDYLDQNRTCVKTECLTDVKLSVIYHETLEKRLKEKPEIYQYFLHSEARKFRLLMLKIAEEKFNPVLGQLSAFLFRLSILSEDIKKERIQFTITHEEIADRLGCSRISVTNNMNRLVEKNIVAYEGRYLIVKDKKRLMELINLF